MTFLCLSFFDLPSDDTNTNIQSVNTKRVHHETKSVFEETFRKKCKKNQFSKSKEDLLFAISNQKSSSLLTPVKCVWSSIIWQRSVNVNFSCSTTLYSFKKLFLLFHCKIIFFCSKKQFRQFSQTESCAQFTQTSTASFSEKINPEIEPMKKIKAQIIKNFWTH